MIGPDLSLKPIVTVSLAAPIPFPVACGLTETASCAMLVPGRGEAGSWALKGKAMDLDVSQSDVARVLGRAAKPISVSYSRELNATDLLKLETEQGIQPKPLQRIRDSHHALARALASGMPAAEASLVTGFSTSRISILRSDPAFKELLEFYRSDRRNAEADILQRVSTLSLDAIEEIRERLETNPEDIKTRELLDIATAGLDRTGFGPTSKLQVERLTLTTEDMLKLSEKSKDANVTILEGRKASPGVGGSPALAAKPLAEDEIEGLESPWPGVREEGPEGTSAQDGERVPPQGPSLFRAVGEIHRPLGEQLCSTGPLHLVPGNDPAVREQAETEHHSGGAASAAVQTPAGVPVQAPGVHNPSLQLLEIPSEQVRDKVSE